MEPAIRTSLRDDARSVAWWVLVGAGSGALAGLLVGGIGGRIAMLLLRLTSPDAVQGTLSDNGFEIGVVSVRTLNLLLATTALGAANGVLYAALRGAIPRRARLALWVLFAAAVGGAVVVSPDGVDFTLLEPALLAVVLFVALPALAAALVVVLVERWTPLDLAEHRRLRLALVAGALAGTVALALAALVAALALALRRAPAAAALLGRVAGVAVPLALVALIVAGGRDLARDVSTIL